MAKGVYDKKRPTAKKVSSFDTKIIVIVVAAVMALVVGIVVALVISSIASSYVATVDGTRISTFDYRLFLEQAKDEMEDGQENLDASTFWTAEKIKEAQDKALDEAKEFYAEYLLAKDKGFALTRDEKTEFSNQVLSTISYYHTYYTSYSLDDITAMLIGSSVKYDEIGDYVQYYAKLQAISNYKSSLQDKYGVDDLKYFDEDEKLVSTGEQAIKDEYAANRDDYRRINFTTLAISKGSAKPTAPTVVEEPVKPETEDETSAEYVEYQSKLTAYNTYLENVKTYEENLKKWEDEFAILETKVNNIYTALLNDGKYTGKGVKATVETEDEDADGNKVKVANEYQDATLEDIAEKESEKYSSDKGHNLFYGEPSETDLLAVLAHSMEWTDDSRTAVKSLLAERWAKAEESAAEETDGSEEGGEEAELPADDEAGETEATGETETTGETEAEAEKKDEDPWAEYNNDYTFESVSEDGKFKETKVKLFADASYFYIVKCTGIDDLDTSTEEAPSEEEADEDTILSVRAVVIRMLKSVTANDEAKTIVKDAGAKYELKDKKDKNIAAVSEKIFTSSTAS